MEEQIKPGPWPSWTFWNRGWRWKWHWCWRNSKQANWLIFAICPLISGFIKDAVTPFTVSWSLWSHLKIYHVDREGWSIVSIFSEGKNRKSLTFNRRSINNEILGSEGYFTLERMNKGSWGISINYSFIFKNLFSTNKCVVICKMWKEEVLISSQFKIHFQ